MNRRLVLDVEVSPKMSVLLGMKSRAAILVGAISLAAVITWALFERRQRSIGAQELAKLKDQNALEERQLVQTASALEITKREIADLESKQKKEVGSVPNAEDGSDGTLERVGQLKRTLLLHPEYGLPEFSLLRDEDWIKAAKAMTGDTEIEALKALGVLRQGAKQKAVPALLAAVDSYRKENNGRLPHHAQLLKPYLPDADLQKTLERYELKFAHAGKQPWYLEDRRFANVWTDISLSVGETSVRLESTPFAQALALAEVNFKKEHGRNPATMAELAPYLKRLH